MSQAWLPASLSGGRGTYRVALYSVWLVSPALHARGLRYTGDLQGHQQRTSSIMAAGEVTGKWCMGGQCAGLGELLQVALTAWWPAGA